MNLSYLVLTQFLWKRTLQRSGIGFLWARCASCHQTNVSVTSSKQSTVDCLILSSSITRLQMEGCYFLYISSQMPVLKINTSAAKTLQSVLHLAARLIVQKRKFDNITPTLRDDLHWLPVPQRIVYRLLPASNCTEVPPRAMRASHNYCQSPSLALSCSWWRTSAGNKNCHFRTSQFWCKCPQTLEQFTTCTPNTRNKHWHSSAAG